MTKKHKTKKTKALAMEYSKTVYLVLVGSKTYEIFENKINPEFNKFLIGKKAKTFALVTSDNPFSQQLTTKENVRRRKSLKILLQMLKLKFVNASSRPNTTSWKPEIGFCIFNIDRKIAKRIGAIFEQNAIVYGTLKSKVKILWISN